MLVIIEFISMVRFNNMYYSCLKEVRDMLESMEVVEVSTLHIINKGGSLSLIAGEKEKEKEKEKIGLWIDLVQIEKIFCRKSLEVKLFKVALSEKAILKTVGVFALARFVSFAWKESVSS